MLGFDAGVRGERPADESANEAIAIDETAAEGLAVLWAEQQRALLLRSAMLHTMRAALPRRARQLEAEGDAATGSAGRRGSGKGHVPLMQRSTAESVESRTKGRAK